MKALSFSHTENSRYISEQKVEWAGNNKRGENQARIARKRVEALGHLYSQVACILSLKYFYYAQGGDHRILQ